MIRTVYSTFMLPILLVSTVDATELQLRSSRRLQQAGPASVLSMIERDIRDLIRFRREDADAGNVDLRPKILRLGFHDCVGGCDGCVDLTNADNNGLDVPIQALQPIVEQYVNNAEIQALLGDGVTLSRADIWAFATLLSADSSEDSDIGTFPMQFLGRIDCENKGGACFDADGVTEVPCTSTRGPHRELPGPNLNTHQLLQFFSSNFGFDARMTVAIMGAHSIGQMTRTNSGFEGSWVGNERRLDNGYYAQLVGGDGDVPPENENILRHAPTWNVEELINTDLENIPDRVQWASGGGNLAMLNSDIAIVRDLSSQNEDIPGMQFLDEDTGMVDTCTFRCRGRNNQEDVEEFGCPNQNPPACPLARMTLEIAAEYKFSLTSWVQDFEEALIRMLHQGYEYDTNADCQPTSPCLLTPNDVNNDNIESPTGAPTLSPTPSPTESPTPAPTTAPTAAVVPTTPSPTATGNDGGGEGDDDDTCVDPSNKFNFVNKKDLTKIVTDKKCSWVAKKWNKRCGKFLLEDDTSKKAKHICPRACGVCIPEGLECSPLTKKKCKQNAGCKYDKTDDTCVNRN